MKLPIFILILILMSSLAIAIQPQKNFIEQAGLNIEYPKIDEFKIGEEIELNFHVFNSSGFPLTNDSAWCHIHIYNSNGEHLYDNNLSFHKEFDFYVEFNNGLNYIGKYSYVVQCLTKTQSTAESGFISVPFIVNSSIKNPDGDFINWLFLIHFLGMIGLLLWNFIMLVNWKNIKIVNVFIAFGGALISWFIGLIVIMTTNFIYLFGVLFRLSLIFFILNVFFFIILILLNIRQTYLNKKINPYAPSDKIN